MMVKGHTAEYFNKTGPVYKYPISSIHLTARDTECVLLGEMIHDKGQKGALRHLKMRKNFKTAKFVPFDILEYKGQSIVNLTLEVRKSRIRRMGTPQVGFFQADNEATVMDIYRKAVKEGFEGVVVKSCNSRYATGPCDWVKLKQKDRNDYSISEIDPCRERIGVIVKTSMGINIVGVKVCERYKRHLTVGAVVTIEHQGVTESGSLRHPVYVA